jgi:hypothetical protein
MTRKERIQQQVAGAGALYRSVMQKAYNGTASPRSAIKAQCLICVGYVRDDVTNCTGFNCPLWAYRPYQIKGVGHDTNN